MTESLEALYLRTGHLVLRRARRLLGQSEDASDVLQDVFLELAKRRDELKGSASVTTWLYSVTTHQCLNRLRNRRTRQRLLAEQGPPLRGGGLGPECHGRTASNGEGMAPQRRHPPVA